MLLKSELLFWLRLLFVLHSAIHLLRFQHTNIINEYARTWTSICLETLYQKKVSYFKGTGTSHLHSRHAPLQTAMISSGKRLPFWTFSLSLHLLWLKLPTLLIYDKRHLKTLMEEQMSAGRLCGGVLVYDDTYRIQPFIHIHQIMETIYGYSHHPYM